MKTILIIMALGLISCGENRDDKKVAIALAAVKLAAWNVGLQHSEADHSDASLADGVDYYYALAELKTAEATATEMLATEDEIKLSRKNGELEGKKFAASLRKRH